MSTWERHKDCKVRCSPTDNSHDMETTIMSIDREWTRTWRTRIRGNATQPLKRMKICHLQPRGWTQRLTYWGNKDRQRKNKISDDRPYMWHPKRNHTNEHIYKTETDSHTYTNLPGWGCCHPILQQIFRKEAGGGNPTLGEMETPWLFRLMWLFQPQTPLCFGVTRLVHIHKCKFIHYGCYRGITGHGGDRILRELAPTVHISSVEFSCSVMSYSLQTCGLQHARPPCPSPTPGVYSNSCPLNWWCHPTISSPVIPFSSLPSIFPSITVFSNESALHIRWPKCWSFSFNISPSNEYSGLISFRMDWLDLLAVQGTLQSLLQHHSSKASILRHSAFFIVQLSHPYMTTGKP